MCEPYSPWGDEVGSKRVFKGWSHKMVPTEETETKSEREGASGRLEKTEFVERTESSLGARRGKIRREKGAEEQQEGDEAEGRDLKHPP